MACLASGVTPTGNNWQDDSKLEAWAFAAHAYRMKMHSDPFHEMVNSICLEFGQNERPLDNILNAPDDETFVREVNWESTSPETQHEDTSYSGDGEIEEVKAVNPDIATPPSAMPDITVAAASDITGIEEALLQSFLNVESGGNGLDLLSGYPTCRFEVRQWASRNPMGWREASKLFEGEETWQGGDDRVLMKGSWDMIHQGQMFIREVILFASTFGEEDQAFACSSWGAAQIMGWHHKVLGYDTAKDMANAFVDEQKQMLGFIMFLGYSGCAEMLRQDNLREAIKIYNGRGQVEYYLGKITEEYYGITGTHWGEREAKNYS